MAREPIVTREIAPLPERADDAHKGEVGRIVIVGGCCDETVAMIGAPALAASAAFRAGAGLVQLMVPEALRPAMGVLAPCATLRTLPTRSSDIVAAAEAFGADVLAIGPGLGRSLSALCIAEVLSGFAGPKVVDADALNLLAEAGAVAIAEPSRTVLTPHPGEAQRLLQARGANGAIGRDARARRAMACAVVEAYGCVVVLKGRGTVVTDGQRLYINETGNAGLATGGTGDVLTGVIAALMGQRLPAVEAAILGVYLHGLAGDFAAEELGRWSMTATDLVEYLPEAFGEHQVGAAE